MQNDFEKFATRHLGMNSQVLHDVVSMQNQYLNPYILEERQLNVTQMDVFSRLMMDRIIFLGVRIDDDVANIIQAQMLYLASVNPKEDIKLYINSPGGSVSSGMSIYDTMNIIEPNVSTICTGRAASMAAVLLCSGEKGKRMMLPHSRALIHQPLGGVQGQASDILIAAKEIELCRKELCSIIAANCQKDYDKVFADIDRDYWMSAEEAKEYGMIDQVINHR